MDVSVVGGPPIGGITGPDVINILLPLFVSSLSSLIPKETPADLTLLLLLLLSLEPNCLDVTSCTG